MHVPLFITSHLDFEKKKSKTIHPSVQYLKWFLKYTNNSVNFVIKNCNTVVQASNKFHCNITNDNKCALNKKHIEGDKEENTHTYEINALMIS